MTDSEFYEDAIDQFTATAIFYKNLHPAYVRTRMLARQAAREWAMIADSLRPKRTT